MFPPVRSCSQYQKLPMEWTTVTLMNVLDMDYFGRARDV